MIISGVHNGSVCKKKVKEQHISNHTFKSDEPYRGKIKSNAMKLPLHIKKTLLGKSI